MFPHVIPDLLDREYRFDYETEMLILVSRKNFRIGAVPISTVYSDEVSSIHPVRDTLRFFKLMRRTNGGVPTLRPMTQRSRLKLTLQANPRRRKSPTLPPDERSIRSMVNFSRQTSQASSTP